MEDESNFSCVLKGKAKYLEQIKEYIITEYVNKGLVKLTNPTCDTKELYIMTKEQWEKYQKLKNKNPELIGFGYPSGIDM